MSTRIRAQQIAPALDHLPALYRFDITTSDGVRFERLGRKAARRLLTLLGSGEPSRLLRMAEEAVTAPCCRLHDSVLVEL